MQQAPDKIEYVEDVIILPPPVKKQVWDNDQQTFVEMTLYRRKGTLNKDQLTWLQKTFGNEGVYNKGQYWDYSRSGDFIVMDERVYTWYSMKWGNQ